MSSSPLWVLPLLALLRLLMWALVRESPVSAVSYSQSSNKWPHSLYRYDDNSVLFLSETGQDHHDDFNKTLNAILKPRVPGTEGHRQVKEYLIQAMSDLNWHVEEDSFTAQTPIGRKPFTNIVASLNPKACRYLVLACHYDSKMMKGRFLGATDSAVPCAMLVHLARSLDGALRSKNHTMLSLQMIFFDGEEAFKTWSSRDSLYGSRHLAEVWNRSPPTGESCTRKSEEMVSRLDQMDVLVLLDLLGSANPKFYNYFTSTEEVYHRLPAIEKLLNSLETMDGPPPRGQTNYFASKTSWSLVDDDHAPFMEKGVPIIHLIPSPFPAVWHTEADNGSNLHHPTIANLNKVFRIFVSEYLHLNPVDHKAKFV